MNQVMDFVLTTIAQTEQPTIHLVDIENLIGSGKFGFDQVREAFTSYMQCANLKPYDLVVIAAGPQNRTAIYEGWPGATYLWRKGQDGADSALLDLMLSVEDLKIFGEMCIASGDNMLADAADLARMAEIPVRVVSRPESRSWRLRPYSFSPYRLIAAKPARAKSCPKSLSPEVTR